MYVCIKCMYGCMDSWMHVGIYLSGRCLHACIVSMPALLIVCMFLSLGNHDISPYCTDVVPVSVLMHEPY